MRRYASQLAPLILATAALSQEAPRPVLNGLSLKR